MVWLHTIRRSLHIHTYIHSPCSRTSVIIWVVITVQTKRLHCRFRSRLGLLTEDDEYGEAGTVAVRQRAGDSQSAFGGGWTNGFTRRIQIQCLGLALGTVAVFGFALGSSAGRCRCWCLRRLPALVR
jgi:hypothetical protein